MMAEAMKFAIERVNNNTGYLHGYKLGIFKIFDEDTDTRVKKVFLNTFMNDVPFMIGPYSSELSYIGSILTTTLTLMTISYSATYSDFGSMDFNKDVMLRSVPSDNYRIQAMLDLIQEFKWNYIAVISSYGFDGQRDSQKFISKLSSIDVCIADNIYLPQNAPNEVGKAIATANSDSRLKAVILFTTKYDSSLILSSIQKQNLTARFYLVCVFGCTNYIEVVEGNEKAAAGTISVDIQAEEIPEFKDYYLKQNPEFNKNIYFKRFWEKLFNCSLDKDYSNCIRNNISLGKGYYKLTPVHTVINAIEAVAKLLRKIIEIKCAVNSTNTNEICGLTALFIKWHSFLVFPNLVQEAFKDGTLKQNASNSVRYDIQHYLHSTHKNHSVGHWEAGRDSNTWNATERRLYLKEDFKQLILNENRAICSEECEIGYVRKRDRYISKERCCWKCNKCPENNIAVNDTCIRCKNIEMPDITKKFCQLLPERYVGYQNNLFTPLILIASSVGLLIVSFVAILFMCNNSNRMVRASGRDSCYMILFGVFLTFVCPFAYISKPSVASCVFRGILPGLAFVICYVPLFLKTNRIYRIFRNAQKSVMIPSLVSPQSQFFICVGIAAVQILLTSIWFVSKSPSPVYVPADTRLYVTIHCKGDSSPILMLLNLVLSVFSMLACTVLAFKTRDFPKNYNEAMFIGITLYVTCIVWAIFLPVYFVRAGGVDFWREYLMCGICVSVGYITVLGLFAQKVRIIIYPPQPGVSQNNSQMLPFNLSEDGRKYEQRTQEETL